MEFSSEPTSRMTGADNYRAKAAEFATLARVEINPQLQIEYARMAQSYLRLAALADQNSQTDIVYESGPLLPPEDSAGSQTS